MITGELNEQQMTNVLSSQVIGRLACSDGKYPYVIPITYLFDGGSIISQSFEGKKLDIMRKNPNVCLQVDIVMDLNTWQSVLIHGQFEELTGQEAIDAYETLCEKIMPLMTNNIDEKGKINQESKNDAYKIKNKIFKIRIIEKTGKFSKM
jgi:hypothetical protein